tara:strand:- start:376 stop:768 length:393 start_codon:yes stop_codon:yes gene_type:complete
MNSIFEDLDTKQSMKSSQLILDNIKYEHENKCRVEFGLVGGTNVSHTKNNLVDLENDLIGLTRTSNKCSEFQYVPAEGTILNPINYIKPTENPQLNLEKEHLKSCNFFDYQEVPKEPVLGYDRCDNNAKF